MEKYERKIKITRELTSIDTNGDGVEDTLALLNKKDLYVSFLLKQSIKDIGIYTDYQEEPEVVDLGNFWETNNDGFDDGGVNPISGSINNPYGDGVDVGEYLITDNGGVVTYGCNDPNALNPPPAGVIYDVECCCDYGENISFQGSNSGVDEAGSAGGCHVLSTEWTEWDQENYPNPLLQPYGGEVNFLVYSLYKAIDWCKAIHPSCNQNWVDGNSFGYPISNPCEGNGCGGQTCCPGPPNTHHVLTEGECDDFGLDCTGSGCACGSGNPFHGVKTNYQTDVNSGLVKYTWKFYCIPD